MRVDIHPTHPQQRLIDKAVEQLRRGGVVVYPTDTVYGIGCDITDKKALEKVYALKRMSKDHPVGFVCPDLGDIARYAVVDDANYRVMRRLLPGPYTFILPATREVPKIVMRKQKTVGIRVPHHEVALSLVRALGNPIVSTSASIDGVQHADPDEIVAQFGRADTILDAGWGGLEPSTIIDLTGHTPVVVREGAGPVDVI